MKQSLKSVINFCAYSQLYNVIKRSIQHREVPLEAKTGAQIALLAVFCPLFWGAVILGAEPSTILLHAIHSGIVFLTGVSIMVVGYFKEAKKIHD